MASPNESPTASNSDGNASPTWTGPTYPPGSKAGTANSLSEGPTVSAEKKLEAAVAAPAPRHTGLPPAFVPRSRTWSQETLTSSGATSKTKPNPELPQHHDPNVRGHTMNGPQLGCQCHHCHSASWAGPPSGVPPQGPIHLWHPTTATPSWHRYHCRPGPPLHGRAEHSDYHYRPTSRPPRRYNFTRHSGLPNYPQVHTTEPTTAPADASGEQERQPRGGSTTASDTATEGSPPSSAGSGRRRSTGLPPRPAASVSTPPATPVAPLSTPAATAAAHRRTTSTPPPAPPSLWAERDDAAPLHGGASAGPCATFRPAPAPAHSFPAAPHGNHCFPGAGAGTGTPPPARPPGRSRRGGGGRGRSRGPGGQGRGRGRGRGGGGGRGRAAGGGRRSVCGRDARGSDTSSYWPDDGGMMAWPQVAPDWGAAGMPSGQVWAPAGPMEQEWYHATSPCYYAPPNWAPYMPFQAGAYDSWTWYDNAASWPYQA